MILCFSRGYGNAMLLFLLLTLSPVSGFLGVQCRQSSILPTTGRLASSLDKNAMESVWRHVKKPLLSIGSRGASATHGNSLRQLLEDHTVVKVKFNSKPYDNDLQTAFEALAQLAVEAGAPQDLELLQARERERIVLFGMPGTRQRVLEGRFPPPSSQD